MDPRRMHGNSQWYHESQTSQSCQRTALVPEAATVADRFLLGLAQTAQGEVRTVLDRAESLLRCSREMYCQLFPESLSVSLTHTLTLYERLSTALTVAQVTGVQRLCNHYAARLNPLPGPDSSRESNRRLTQITEYARQLAGQPTLINTAALQRLDEVGLTSSDVISFSQIIGFVSFQARAVAGLHAMMGLPSRWMPGVFAPPDAESLCGNEWHPAIVPLERRYATDAQQQALEVSTPLLFPASYALTLAHDGRALETLSALLVNIQQRYYGPDSALAAATAARINGSSLCFFHYPSGSLRDALEKSVESGLATASARQRAIIALSAQLTRQPERFSSADLQSLREAGVTGSDLFSIILSAAAAAWCNRLRQSLGVAQNHRH